VALSQGGDLTILGISAIFELKMILYCLVVGIPTPLKNMSSSVGMMTIPTYGKKQVPNHQPVYMGINMDYPTNIRES
jgi:hypothetical protein